MNRLRFGEMVRAAREERLSLFGTKYPAYSPIGFAEAISTQLTNMFNAEGDKGMGFKTGFSSEKLKGLELGNRVEIYPELVEAIAHVLRLSPREEQMLAATAMGNIGQGNTADFERRFQYLYERLENTLLPAFITDNLGMVIAANEAVFKMWQITVEDLRNLEECKLILQYHVLRFLCGPEAKFGVVRELLGDFRSEFLQQAILLFRSRSFIQIGTDIYNEVVNTLIAEYSDFRDRWPAIKAIPPSEMAMKESSDVRIRVKTPNGSINCSLVPISSSAWEDDLVLNLLLPTGHEDDSVTLPLLMGYSEFTGPNHILCPIYKPSWLMDCHSRKN